ncbi:MAG: hypothetical protein UX89_C0001G0044 [Parcubacteria group bacterium GW2011_GWA2_47_16]|nr:MAG: hypothetical protein UX89_C0001G0044 [Parcubacteria group bacterium GW2011_GWA2_47_16]
MLQQLVIGNALKANASSTKGWVAGHFMPEGLGQTGDFEIKLWRYDEQPDYGQKTFGGTEFIIVERGALKLELEVPNASGSFDSCMVELKGSTRDYVILPPGCIKGVVVLEAPSYGVTVRWPSVSGSNVVVKEKGQE